MNTDLIKVKTAPVTDPVLFAEADEWCRDIDVADTALVNALISAATDIIGKMTNRTFLTTVFTASFDCFSNSDTEPLLFVELRRSPLMIAEDIIVTVNGDILASADYIVKESNTFSRILFNETYTLDDDVAYPISVEFSAGYGIESDVPEGLITAIKQTVLFWYENRGDVNTDGKMRIPNVALPMIKNYRIVNSFG